MHLHCDYDHIDSQTTLTHTRTHHTPLIHTTYLLSLTASTVTNCHGSCEPELQPRNTVKITSNSQTKHPQPLYTSCMHSPGTNKTEYHTSIVCLFVFNYRMSQNRRTKRFFKAQAQTLLYGPDNRAGQPESNTENFTQHNDNTEPQHDHNSSSESETEDAHGNHLNFDADSLINSLRRWVNESNIPGVYVSSLLKILNQHGLRVPKDHRTLLHTPTSVDVKEKCGGRYIYLGIATGLTHILECDNAAIYNRNAIELKVNVDGLPLFKSSKIECWPILGSFAHYKPFVIALFCGTTKPTDVHEYLRDFTDEMDRLKVTLFEFGGKRVPVVVHAFICDAPARQFLKCIKGHSGFYCCERCVVQGYKENHHVVIHSNKLEDRRTNAEFVEGKYMTQKGDKHKNHQHAVCPLIGYVDCVNGFPLDIVHLVFLGVVRRLIRAWQSGIDDSYMGKLSNDLFTRLSNCLKELHGQMPSNFARQPRKLADWERWKATEYRQFLLYSGPVLLQHVLCQEQYVHFMSLSVAITIFHIEDSERREHYLPHAEELLQFFVQECPFLYSEYFVTYNVHGLLHVADDVRKYRCSLSELNTFPFENHMQKLKKCVRNGHNPAAQIVKRITEQALCEDDSASVLANMRPAVVSTKPRDSCYILKDAEYVFLREKVDDQHFACDVVHKDACSSLYTAPLDSKDLNIVYCTNLTIRRSKRRLVHVSQLVHLVVNISHKDGVALLPQVHRE